MEGQGFRDRIQKFEAKNAVVLGISNDPPDKNKHFKDKFDFPFDLLSDETLATAIAYGAAESADAGKATRISYVIGPDGKIKKAYGTVKPPEHPDQVLADL